MGVRTRGDRGEGCCFNEGFGGVRWEWWWGSGFRVEEVEDGREVVCVSFS